MYATLLTLPFKFHLTTLRKDAGTLRMHPVWSSGHELFGRRYDIDRCIWICTGIVIAQEIYYLILWMYYYFSQRIRPSEHVLHVVL